MNILFLGYWSIDEGLTQSTVLPHVRFLAQQPEISGVILCTIERSAYKPFPNDGKILHVPLQSANYRNVLLNKVSDFIRFRKAIIGLIRHHRIDLLMCRTSLAGGIGYLVWRSIRIPYTVESFEPHAAYMLEAGTWSRFDPRYHIEQWLQRRQCATAFRLYTVSRAYAELLASQGVAPGKLHTIPCVVDTNQFTRNGAARRKALGFPEDAIIGIYVGKFGDLYYDEEAFLFFSLARQQWKKFRLIILSPMPANTIAARLAGVGFEPEQYKILKVSHQEVPQYLSAVDFAFATYKASPAKRYLSPIKVGEYWACGLPVILTRGTGDDSGIIEQSGCGALFLPSEESMRQALREIDHQLQDPAVREKNRNLALQHRNFQLLEQAYRQLFLDFSQQGRNF